MCPRGCGSLLLQLTQSSPKHNKRQPLSSVPHAGDLGVAHLALELEDAVHEGFGGRRAAGDVDVDRDDTVAATDDTVAVVVVAATVGAAAHGDDPSGLRHLIVDLAKSRGHLVGQGTGDNHDVGLARRSTENNTEAILIVTGGGKVHHFDGTAGETECHGPQRGLAGPVGDDVERGTISQRYVSIRGEGWLEAKSCVRTAHIGQRPCCLPR